MVERIILGRTATAAAKELKRQGLLMPDLPDPLPGRSGLFEADAPFFGVRHVQATGNQIVIYGNKITHAPIAQARTLALAILAACNHAETEVT